ncbi:IS1634 family transposase, partial [Mycoplasmopsis pullorum]
INDLTGLVHKDKFTEHRLITMMKDVKEIEEYFDDKIIDTKEIQNSKLENSWDDYYLVKNVLKSLKQK